MSKIGFISLGCSKNLVDTEIMIGLVEKAGHEIVNTPEAAEILIINTCGFIDAAKEEAIDTILENAVYKKEGVLKKLVVTGCLAQRYRDEIIKEMPEVDMVVGVDEFPRIVSLLEEDGGVFVTGNSAPYPENMPRVRTTPPFMAYLKIAEGCDNRCTYCAIPSIRGPYRSRPMAEIIREAETLFKEGVQELCIVAQDTTRYGSDLEDASCLSELLANLSVIGFPWIRIFYTYADRIDEKLLETVRTYPNIVPYFDIPIQHISDSVLRRMGRRDTESSIRDLLSKIRAEIPSATLRTSLIVGFPGETDADFEKLCDFIGEGVFDRVGVFIYSPEDGTPAAKLTPQIDDEVKKARFDTLMNIAKAVSEEHQREKIGTVELVLTEGFQDMFYVGRTMADGPEVDGKVYFTSRAEIPPGTFLPVRILAAEEYDLIGENENERTE